MPHELVVQNVTETLIGGSLRHPAWRVDFVKPKFEIDGHWFDGEVHNHHIPKAALEWRLAEYDLSSVEEAMDLLLHEPFIETALGLPEAEDDVKTMYAKTMRVSMVDDIEMKEHITAYNAETRGQATLAVRTRLSVVKRRLLVVSSNVTKRTISGTLVKDPLDVIRTTHRVTKAGVAERKRFVTALRQNHGFDLDQPRVFLPNELEARKMPPQEDSSPRRILEQMQDPKDHMWG